MNLFGKSKEELKQIAAYLEKRQSELDSLESTLTVKQSNMEHEKALLDNTRTQFNAEREAFRDKVKQEREDIALENAALEGRQLEIIKLEAEAKAGFVKSQREAFKEVIDNRMAELDARQKELEELEKRLALDLKNLHTEKSEIAMRQLAVTEREQKADAGFADKAKALAEETARNHRANQAEAKRLQVEADALAADRQQYELNKAELVKREQAIIAEERRRDAGFADERAALDTELLEKRQKIDSEIADFHAEKLAIIDEELKNYRAKRLKEVENFVNIERERVQAQILAERENWEKQRETEIKQLEIKRLKVEKKDGLVIALQSELEGRRAELEESERVLKRKEARLEQQWNKRIDEIENVIADRLEEERQSMESVKRELKAENERLREGLRIQMDLVGAFDQLKRQLGDLNPVEVLKEINNKTRDFMKMRENYETRAVEEMREKNRELESEIEQQKHAIENLRRQARENAETAAEVKNLRRSNSALEADNKMLQHKAILMEGAANAAQAELERLRAAYERPAEVEARYREIELPYIKEDKFIQPVKDDNIDEITWLKGVGNACENYGFYFHPRILKAFHTALKTAEWSPLTILAGVSGTGKSELPRLYSHFGGLMFEPLSVQPNWDSQESMLGFFNSIDNKFDAQPVLRFLAQSQKKWIKKNGNKEGYPGLQDAVCLVLLDEMNLAHPELYFAEFLSKLELRRGMKGTDVPSLQVKIGAGMPAYQLPLGRNVLWTGTMNQDETTKSLSDKVLDRSIIIYFPRPTKLKRRLKLAPLDENNRGPLLHKASWQGWLAQKGFFSEDDIKPFKKFIEDMNRTLAVVGRAIGHRVWQSVEYYMANYPDVRVAQKMGDKNALTKALHIAFEDQLVQKVMPKLRGIDTRGKSKTDCLDKILGQINIGIGGQQFNLAEDFNLACELGYGQFIWQSANYLKDEQTIETD
ncbi:MAG: chromosome partitioning protein ParA [bacterium]